MRCSVHNNLRQFVNLNEDYRYTRKTSKLVPFNSHKTLNLVI